MTIRRDRDTLYLENDWLRRQIDVAEGPVTTRLTIRPHGKSGADTWLPFSVDHPLEAAVFIAGREYQAGAFSRSQPSEDPRAGGFRVEGVAIDATPLGQAATLICLPRRDPVPAIELRIRYEVAERLPLLIKSVSARNAGATALTIENLTVEMGCLGQELRRFTDYYEGNGATNCADPGYHGWTRSQFPQPIDYALAPGETLESYRVFEYVAPNDPAAAAATKSRLYIALAPWLTEFPISQTVDDAATIEELRQVAVDAADNGVEVLHLYSRQLFTNVGDYVPRPDLFPNGYDDVRRLVEHCRRLGIKVIPYVALTGAWQAAAGPHRSRVEQEHPDWQYLGPNGERFSAWAWGNMCYQSPWGEYIRRKLDNLLDAVGFDGLHIDCPYHGLPCFEKNHRHRAPASVPFMNWQWERAFLGEMRRRGLVVTTPQDPAALLLGANAMPGGYTEEDYAALGGMPLVSSFRARLYDRRPELPACCSWAWLALDKTYGHSIEASEEAPASYEHALAATLGYGHRGLLHGRKLFIGPVTRRIFQRWMAFHRSHRETLNGAFIHLLRPDGRRPDAMMHANPEADPPAVVVAFNPSGEAADLGLALPLHYAGFAPGQRVRVQDQDEIQLDARGTGLLRLTLAPWEVRTVDMRPA